MTEQRPDFEQGAKAGAEEDSPPKSQKRSEDEPKVTRRMSVEEHLAGLWKVLGLGD